MQSTIQAGVESFLRRDIQQTQRKLITRWLGSLQMLCDEPMKKGRLFGAIFIVIVKYGWHEDPVLVAGLDSLAIWLAAVEEGSACLLRWRGPSCSRQSLALPPRGCAESMRRPTVAEPTWTTH